MEAAFDLDIVRWAAWAPELSTVDDWSRWARSPGLLAGSGRAPVRFLPPMLRRRCRRLSRAALDVAWRCLAPGEREDAWLVYGSRYGETATTVALLERVVGGELLSPTDFGLSVHSTPTGMFSIAAGNREPSTAVAAGPSTFCHTLLEAAAQRARAPASRVVLAVVADEPVPDVFQPSTDGLPALYALGLTLGRADAAGASAGARLRLRLEAADPVEEIEGALPQALEFVRWALSGEEELVFRTRGLSWVLSCDTRSWADLFVPAEADGELA